MVAMGLAFSGVALLVALGSAGFFFIRFSERQEELLARLQAGEGEQAARAARLQEALGDLAREQEATLAGLRADGERSAQRLVELERSAAGASAKLGADLSRLEERLEGLSGLSDSLERQERELARLAEETRALRDELDALALRGPAAPAATPAQAGGAGPAALARTPGGETAAQEPTWKSWLGDLASQNSGTRWQAVQSLGATGDPAVVPHLAPMLKDADIFVRMASARILGDLGAIEAIPALIDALEDEEASVREASLVSLRGISGQSIPFDPLAKDAERAKRVKAWRDWWAEASEQLHGQGKMRPRG
jgi:HEAT repeat protein